MKKLKSEVKSKWVAALRSGEYEQNHGSLTNRDRTKHCCLGVLCELAIKEGVIPEPVQLLSPDGAPQPWKYGTADDMAGSAFVLPLAVQEWAGLEQYDTNPSVYYRRETDQGEIDEMVALSSFNDGSSPLDRAYDFSEIADLIEEHL